MEMAQDLGVSALTWETPALSLAQSQLIQSVDATSLPRSLLLSRKSAFKTNQSFSFFEETQENPRITCKSNNTLLNNQWVKEEERS